MPARVAQELLQKNRRPRRSDRFASLTSFKTIAPHQEHETWIFDMPAIYQGVAGMSMVGGGVVDPPMSRTSGPIIFSSEHYVCICRLLHFGGPRQPAHQRGDVVFLDTLVATSSTSFQPTAFPSRLAGVSFWGCYAAASCGTSCSTSLLAFETCLAC